MESVIPATPISAARRHRRQPPPHAVVPWLRGIQLVACRLSVLNCVYTIAFVLSLAAASLLMVQC